MWARRRWKKGRLWKERNEKLKYGKMPRKDKWLMKEESADVGKERMVKGNTVEKRNEEWRSGYGVTK